MIDRKTKTKQKQEGKVYLRHDSHKTGKVLLHQLDPRRSVASWQLGVVVHNSTGETMSPAAPLRSEPPAVWGL